MAWRLKRTSGSNRRNIENIESDARGKVARQSCLAILAIWTNIGSIPFRKSMTISAPV